MGVSSLPKAVAWQHRGCNLNSGPSATESSMLTTRLPSLLWISRHRLVLRLYLQPVNFIPAQVHILRILFSQKCNVISVSSVVFMCLLLSTHWTFTVVYRRHAEHSCKKSSRHRHRQRLAEVQSLVQYTGEHFQWSQLSCKSCKFLYFCSCPVLSCISFVSCIFLYLRLLLIMD